MASSRGLSLLVLLFLSLSTYILAQSTCSASSPCAQGCCSKFGNCGFGPDFCSAANCVGTCNATSECGQYAPANQTLCPLNVCCSQYGFCGTTADFCGTGCQNGCTQVTRPSCGGASSDQRTIGYYESWSYNRTCDAWAPENINANLWTHINYAFAMIDSSNKIAAMNSFDVQLYPRVTALKKYNPNLKVFISVGGWAAGGKVWSNMVSTVGGQLTFISSVLNFLQTYGFDGVDIDWEYPVAPDRDGAAADFANFVAFIRLLKGRLGTKYGVSLTLPSSYWYLRGFDIAKLSPNVDWFNFMSYDIHGTWDGNSPYTQAVVNPHTNLTEIQNGLDLLWRNNIPPSKVVLGLGFYGRSFTLKNPSCKTPGCPFLSGGKAGTCTGTSGILSNAEIQRIITSKSLTPTLDTTAAIKYITWDNDQWVSYDDAQTLAMKKTFANNQCLGGTMVWALDQDDPNGVQSQRNLALEGLRAQGDNIDINPWRAYSKASTITYENGLQLLVFWTDCMKDPVCPTGFRMLTKGHGKIFDIDEDTVTGDGCHGGWGGNNRALCIEANVYFTGTCNWYGRAGFCNEGCPAGSMLLSSNSHVGPNSCNHNRYKNFCCTGFVEAESVQVCPGTNANNALLGGLGKRGISDVVGTRLECDGLTQGLAAVAGLSLTAAATYVFLSLPGTWRYSIGRGWFWDPLRNIVFGSAGPPVCTSTTTEQVDVTTFTNSPKTTGCDFNLYPQACAHYLSVTARYPRYQTLTCPVLAKSGRRAPAKWDRQHSDTSWRRWIDHMPGVARNSDNDRCNRDEYPPLRFVPAGTLVSPLDQWIRFLPATQNQDAGKLWQNVCTLKSQSVVSRGPVNNNVCTDYKSVITTVNGFVLTAMNRPNPYNDDLLSANICVPTSVTNDMGYALFTDDLWYNQARNQNNLIGSPYKNPVPANLIGGRTPPRPAPDQLAKRWLHEDYDGSDPANIIVDDGNSTRPATEDELFDTHGILKCKTPGCRDETIDGYKIEVIDEVEPQVQEMEVPEMTVTATTTSRVLRLKKTAARLSSGPTPTAPVFTDSAEMHLRRHQHGHHHRGS